jgi:aminocarboxymuconate-semialdehyde decarboxylase
MIIDAQHHYYVEGFPLAAPEERLRWMDEYGITMAIPTNPMRASAENLSKLQSYNDQLATMAKNYPERFIFCPTIPIYDEKAAFAELERAREKSPVRAVFIQPLSWRMDSPGLQRFYEHLAKSQTLIIMHPVYMDLPVEPVYGSHALGAAIGFPFNTTVTITSLIFSGVMEAYPELKIVLPHLGGALPFLIGRLDAVYASGEYKLPKPPSEYLKLFYFDTVAYQREPIEMTLKLFGPGRLVFGTDYSCPGKGFVRPAEFLSFIRSLDLSAEAKEGILGGNLARLLGLEAYAPKNGFIEETIRA